MLFVNSINKSLSVGFMQIAFVLIINIDEWLDLVGEWSTLSPTTSIA